MALDISSKNWMRRQGPRGVKPGLLKAITRRCCFQTWIELPTLQTCDAQKMSDIWKRILPLPLLPFSSLARILPLPNRWFFFSPFPSPDEDLLPVCEVDINAGTSELEVKTMLEEVTRNMCLPDHTGSLENASPGTWGCKETSLCGRASQSCSCVCDESSYVVYVACNRMFVFWLVSNASQLISVYQGDLCGCTRVGKGLLWQSPGLGTQQPLAASAQCTGHIMFFMLSSRLPTCKLCMSRCMWLLYSLAGPFRHNQICEIVCSGHWKLL